MVPALHTCKFECLMIAFSNQGLIIPHIPILMKYCLCMDGWFSLGATPYIPCVPHPNKLHVLHPPVGILISCAYLPHLHVTCHLYQYTSLTHSRTHTPHAHTHTHITPNTLSHVHPPHTSTHTHTHTTTLTHTHTNIHTKLTNTSHTPTSTPHPHPHTSHTYTHHTEGVTTHAPALL